MPQSTTEVRKKAMSNLRNPRANQEDAALAELVVAWVNDTAKPEDREVELAFVDAEFDDRLTSYRASSRWWRVAQMAAWISTALLELLVAVLAGLKTGHGISIVAGALVATLTTFSQARHPGKRADGYLDARLELRDQAWDLLNHIGAYAQLNKDNCHDQFVTHVREVVNRKRTATSWAGLA
jgi:hypothetical protein